MRFSGAWRAAENHMLAGDKSTVDAQDGGAVDQQLALDLGDAILEDGRIQRWQGVVRDWWEPGLAGAGLLEIAQKTVDGSGALVLGSERAEGVGKRLGSGGAARFATGGLTRPSRSTI
jgi:hypothetical protein